MTSELPTAIVVDKVVITDELIIMMIKPQIPFSFKPGQYCTIGINGFERPYSIVSSPHEENLELFVELIPNGKLSPHLWNLGVGDMIKIRPSAKGIFTLDERYQNHLMVATVTGIAPFLSMVRNYLYSGSDDHRFYILHGASYIRDLVYRDELEDISAKHENIHYVSTVSRPDDDANQGWNGEEDRVNSLVERYTEKYSLDPTHTIVYACGHPGMVDDVKKRLSIKGYRVKEEKYWRG